MTQIEVPSWVVEAACAKLAVGMEFEGKWPEDYQDEAGDELREAMRAALTAALGAWVVPSHSVTSGIGPTTILYTLRQEKPE